MPGPQAVRVDPRLCEAHALCIEIAPNVFDLGDDVAEVVEPLDATCRDEIDAAIAACPRQAIGWIDDSLITERPVS